MGKATPGPPAPPVAPAPGAMAYRDTDGVWHYANPRDAMYITLTMLASHYWTGSEWKPTNVD